MTIVFNGSGALVATSQISPMNGLTADVRSRGIVSRGDRSN